MWLDQNMILNNYSNYTTVVINLSSRVRVKTQYSYIEYTRELDSFYYKIVYFIYSSYSSFMFLDLI